VRARDRRRSIDDSCELTWLLENADYNASEGYRDYEQQSLNKAWKIALRLVMRLSKVTKP